MTERSQNYFTTNTIQSKKTMKTLNIIIFCLFLTNLSLPISAQSELNQATDKIKSIQRAKTSFLEEQRKAKESLPQLIVESGHSSGVNTVAFSADGRFVVSGGRYDNTVKLWDAATGQELRTFTGHSQPIESVAFSPTGDMIASVSGDQVVMLWDVSTGANLRILDESLNIEESSYNQILFSPDGKKILIGYSSDNRVGADSIEKLWNVSTGESLQWKSSATELDAISISDLSDDWQLSAIPKDKNNIEVFSIETGKVINTLKSHESEIISIDISDDKKFLASLDSGNTLILWDLKTGIAKNRIKIASNKENSKFVRFSPNGQMIVSYFEGREQQGNYNFEAAVWIAASGVEIAKIPNQTGQLSDVGFSPDGEKMFTLTGFEDFDRSMVKMWDLRTGREINAIKQNQANKFEFNKPDKSIFSPKVNSLVYYNSSKFKNSMFQLWNFERNQIYTINAHPDGILSLAFSPDGKTVATSGIDNTIRLWNVGTGNEVKTFESRARSADRVKISADGKRISFGLDSFKGIKLWNLFSGEEPKTLPFKGDDWSSGEFSPDGKIFAAVIKTETVETLSPEGEVISSKETPNSLRLWDVESQREINLIKGYGATIDSVVFSPDGKFIALVNSDQTISLREMATGREARKFTFADEEVSKVIFSSAGNTLAYLGNNAVTFWNVQTGAKRQLALNNEADELPKIQQAAFSPNDSVLALARNGESSMESTVELWNVITGKKIRTIESVAGISENGHAAYNSIAFSANGKIFATFSEENTVASGESTPQGTFNKRIKLWDALTGKMLKDYDFDSPNTAREVSALVPAIYRNNEYEQITSNTELLIKPEENGKVSIYELKTGKLLASLVIIDDKDWIIIAPDGRFDTNKLENPKGLHWLLPDVPFIPYSLEVFTRNYFEPNLLPRLLTCTRENNCSQEFKPLPSIAEINRVQPKVAIKETKRSANSSELADIVVEVTNVTEGVSVSTTDKTKKIQLASGAFDLRLFRDGQLVGVSTQKNDLEKYIQSAPRLVEKDRIANTVLNTEEDKSWRATNDIFKLKSENVKLVSQDTIQYTFRNVKLPRDGRKEVEFTTYVFNSDKVKSLTTEAVKFTIPAATVNTPRKGRAVVLSIGVNASEIPKFNLRYAANDAKKMQEIVSARLLADAGKYSEVISIPLISDYDANKKVTDNTARKAVIKGVFSLLAGNEKEVPAEILSQIPNRDKIKEIQPEDTLIITYAGHGYADRNGIFYLLPFDIGTNSEDLSAVLSKSISSDELSLWMLDITAQEMIFIVDACNSAAAVQGSDFKPGPMGSRGLGQLAYDKGMRILAATQADNVALELNKLQQGLLSYALLQNGIVEKKADTEADFNQLSAKEWLTYGVKRVPEIYEEVKDGKRTIMVDGNSANVEQSRLLLQQQSKQKSAVNLQQPTLFDFSRNKNNRSLLLLP